MPIKKKPKTATKKKPTPYRLDGDQWGSWNGANGRTFTKQLKRSLHAKALRDSVRAYLVESPDGEPLFYVHASDDPSFY